MISKPLPNLQSWTIHFSQQEVPILGYTKKCIGELYEKFDSTNIKDIAQLVRHDPLLSLRIIRHLESHRHSSQVTDVTTIGKVLLMIGLGGFFRSFSHAVTLEEKLSQYPSALQGCLAVCSRAHLAAKIAEGIAIKRSDLDPDEVTTAALLHNTAEILLWMEAPQLATEIKEKLTQTPGLRSRDAQQSTLGISLHDLHLTLIHAWHLPKLMHHLLDDHFADEPRVKTVTTAIALARHLGNGWSDPALHDDYKNVAQLLNIDIESSYRYVQQLCLKAAHEWEWFGIKPVACDLIHTEIQST